MWIGIFQERENRLYIVSLVDRGQEGHAWIVARQELRYRKRFLDVVFQVQYVYEMLRILADLLGSHFGTQCRMAQRNHARVVLGYPIDGARAQAPYEPHQPVLTANACVPAEGVMAERHAGQRREKVLAVARPNHFLDQHRHSLVIVEQPHATAIGQGIRTQDTGIDLRNGVLQCLEILLWSALVGEEKAIILACKGIAKVVFEQARRAHHDG